MKLKKGQFFQMDGEPWILSAGCTATIQPSTRVRMLCPLQSGPGAGIWDRQKRAFWELGQESYNQDIELGLRNDIPSSPADPREAQMAFGTYISSSSGQQL